MSKFIFSIIKIFNIYYSTKSFLSYMIAIMINFKTMAKIIKRIFKVCQDSKRIALARISLLELLVDYEKIMKRL